MKTFNIKVIDQTGANKLFKYYAFIVVPLLSLVLYNQKFQAVKFTGSSELILTMLLLLTPALILAIKLKSTRSEENVSLGNGEIQTALVGPIQIFEIDTFKKSNAQQIGQYIDVVMKNGRKISFSPVVRQFSNAGNKREFQEFVQEFEQLVKSRS